MRSPYRLSGSERRLHHRGQLRRVAEASPGVLVLAAVAECGHAGNEAVADLQEHTRAIHRQVARQSATDHVQQLPERAAVGARRLDHLEQELGLRPPALSRLPGQQRRSAGAQVREQSGRLPGGGRLDGQHPERLVVQQERRAGDRVTDQVLGHLPRHLLKSLARGDYRTAFLQAGLERLDVLDAATGPPARHRGSVRTPAPPGYRAHEPRPGRVAPHHDALGPQLLDAERAQPRQGSRARILRLRVNRRRHRRRGGGALIDIGPLDRNF